MHWGSKWNALQEHSSYPHEFFLIRLLLLIYSRQKIETQLLLLFLLLEKSKNSS